MTDTERDWTAGPDEAGNVRSNNSETFLKLVAEVAQMIRGDAHALLAGRAESTARLIVAQLAHAHRLAPIVPPPQHTLDDLKSWLHTHLEESQGAKALTIGKAAGALLSEYARRASGDRGLKERVEVFLHAADSYGFAVVMDAKEDESDTYPAERVSNLLAAWAGTLVGWEAHPEDYIEGGYDLLCEYVRARLGL